MSGRLPPKPNPFLSYKPSVRYFRQAAYATSDPEELRALALTLCLELEARKAWERDQGLRPPRFFVLPSEAADKPGVVLPFHDARSADEEDEPPRAG